MNALTVEMAGPVWTVTMNRPEARNAVDPEMAGGLREVFEEFEYDDSASVAVLTGAGGTFCSGFDLKRLGDPNYLYLPEGPGPMGPTRMAVSKPVIAAIEGHAVAGGLELALWCDLRVASATAVFGVFCRRWGVPLVDGGTVRLPRLIGQGRAMDMILTGRAVEAKEALVWGLADRMVPAGEARARAEALAADIARFPQLCLKADRASALAQWSLPEAEALKAEGRGGVEPLKEGAEAGAVRFVEGKGRGGDFGSI